jgi:hypothetical protein
MKDKNLLLELEKRIFERRTGARFRTDTNFTSWLTRMIETDGNPLIPGNHTRHLWLRRTP